MGNQKHGNVQSGIVGKWLWRYAVEADALWGGVEDKRCGSTQGGWYSDGVNGPFGVPIEAYQEWLGEIIWIIKFEEAMEVAFDFCKVYGVGTMF